MNYFCKKNHHFWIPPWWEKNRYCLFCGTIDNFHAGQNSITLSPGHDVIRWSATQNALAAGDIGMNKSTGRIQQYVGSSTQNVASASEIPGTAIQLITSAGVITSYSTIALAMAAASSGDKILLKPGTYAESFTIKAGVTLEGYDRKQVTINGAAATGNRITLGSGSVLRNVTILAPTDFTSAIVGNSTGVAYVEKVYIQGAGGSGIGINCYGGTLYLTDVYRISGNIYMFLEQSFAGIVHINQFGDLSTTASCVTFLHTGLCSTYCNNIYVNNTSITYFLWVNSSGIVRIQNLYCLNCDYGIITDSDGTDIQVNGGKINATTYVASFDGTVTDIKLHLIGVDVDDRKINLNTALKYNESPNTSILILGKDDDAEYRKLFTCGKFSVGSFESGSSLISGHGDFYNKYWDFKVFTTDNTAGAANDGSNFVNVTANALYNDGSTFSFQNKTANYSILFGMSIDDDTLDNIKHWGHQYLIDTVSSTDGVYVFEIWNGAAWVAVNYFITGKSNNYRYGNNPFIRDQQELVCLNLNTSTTWSRKAINGYTAYWTRVRITTAATTAPIFSSWQLAPSSIEFDKNGFCRMFGMAKYSFTILGNSNIFNSNKSASTGLVTVGSGGAPTEWVQTLTQSLLTDSRETTTGFIIPKGTCTAMPMYVRLYYYLDGGQPVTVNPSVIISFLPIECSGILVADPAAGITPTARTAANTDTVVANIAQTSTVALVNNTDSRIHSVESSAFSIANYYEGDYVALRIELRPDGTPDQTMIIFAIEVSAVKWASGAVI